MQDLDKLLEQGKEIMERELGFKPVESELEICERAYFEEILKKEKPFPRYQPAVFCPVKLKAYILKAGLDIMFFHAIHEYFGHGSFFEFSMIGKDVVKCLREMKKFHKEFFEEIGQELPEHYTISIFPSNSPGVELNECTEDNHFILKCPHPRFIKYDKLKLGYDNYLIHYNNITEAFAVWLEKFLLKKFNKEDIWIRRRGDTLITWCSDYKKLEKAEENGGIQAVLELAQFPTSQTKIKPK